MFFCYSRPVRSVWNRPKKLKPAMQTHHLPTKRKTFGLKDVNGVTAHETVRVSQQMDEEFAKVTSFENQLASLQQRGLFNV